MVCLFFKHFKSDIMHGDSSHSFHCTTCFPEVYKCKQTGNQMGMNRVLCQSQFHPVQNPPKLHTVCRLGLSTRVQQSHTSIRNLSETVCLMCWTCLNLCKIESIRLRHCLLQYLHPCSLKFLHWKGKSQRWSFILFTLCSHHTALSWYYNKKQTNRKKNLH